MPIWSRGLGDVCKGQVCISPILWRLDLLGISLDGKKAKPIMDYANRLFEKEGFHESLTFAEKDFN